MPEVERLARALREEGGFEVYAHAFDRPDINDYHGPSHHDIRACFNTSGGEAIGFSPILSNLYPHVSSDCRADVLTHGEYLEMETRPAIVRAKRWWPLGWLGLERGVEDPTHRVAAKRRVCDLTEAASSEDAYFLRFTIRAKLLDHIGYGRTSPAFPDLTCVTRGGLVDDAVGYLASHPGDYYPLLMDMLPAGQFPNTRRKILDVAKPGEALAIISYDDITRAREWPKIIDDIFLSQSGRIVQAR